MIPSHRSFKKEQLWAIHSNSSLKKSDRERITLVAFNIRVTMSESLSSLFKKEWFAQDSSKSLSKTSWIRLKKLIFVIFHCFSPFLCPSCKSLPLLWRSLRSSLICSFLKSNRSHSLLSLFKKGWPWVNRSCHSYKKATMSDLLPLLFSKERQEQFAIFHPQIALSLFGSQKTSNSLKNRRVNSLCWISPSKWNNTRSEHISVWVVFLFFDH